MKQQLKKIYDDLANGTLSQKQALERIKAVKQEDQGKGVVNLLAIPVWQASSVEHAVADSDIAYAAHHVILCQPLAVAVESLVPLLPESHCSLLQTAEEKNIAERYSQYALESFERVQSILCSKPAGKVLVQIVIADNPEQVLLVGLLGLLKTAALENPLLTGQLILVPADIKDEELARRLQEERAGHARQ